MSYFSVFALSLRRISLVVLGGVAVTANAAPAKSVRPQMLEIFHRVESLLPLAYDANRFQDPKNKQIISKSLLELQEAVTNLSEHRKDIPVDPFAKLLIPEMSSDVAIAIKLFDQGNVEYARAVVRDFSGYCIGCHTSSKRGKRDFPTNKLVDVKSLSHMDRANFCAATRQYSEAIKEYEYALLEPGFAKRDPKGWELAVKRLLAIVVRVENSSSLAMEMVSRIRGEKAVAPNFDQPMILWRQSTKRWREEGRKLLKTREEKFAKAQALVESAKPAIKQAGIDAALIEYLRASRLLNQVIEDPKRDKIFGEALWLAGQISEEIDEINFWTLDTKYYEACVRFQPKAPLARQCFDRLKVRLLARSNQVNGGAPAGELLPMKLDSLQKLIQQ